MAITFRHDAAAVALPSTNAANRKYGMDLVTQQQQQKYQGQQAGLNRLFEVNKQQQQNAFQGLRDINQQAFQDAQARQQNEFQAGRDKNLFEQQQQQQQAAQQQKFMDDARKQQSAIIMEDIQNGEYDPATARKLQQNLIEEAEALGNPQLDATQRAEALEKIRAARSMLTANRQQKPPPPTAQEEFDKGIVVDPETGMRFRQDSKGEYKPLPPQQLQQPKSAESAFKANPKLKDKYMEEAITITTKGGEQPLTRESRKAAAALAKELWHEDNPEAIGPTADWSGGAIRAPEDPLGATPPAAAGPTADWSAGAVAAPGDEAMTKEMTSQGFTQKIDANGRPYFERDDRPAAQPDMTVQAPDPAMPPSPPPMPAAPPQNNWADVASGGEVQATPPAAPTPQTPMAANRTEQRVPITEETAQAAAEQTMQQPAVSAPPAAPDFTTLAAGAQNDTDRSFISQMQKAYEGQTPEVQSAIGMLLNPNASDREAAEALMYLQANGIDVEKMMATPKKKSNRDWQSGRGL